jgi:hypothetical protein
VTDVGISHEKVLITDIRYHSAASRSWLQSHTLSDDVAIADYQLARLPTVLEILRNRPN